MFFQIVDAAGKAVDAVLAHGLNAGEAMAALQMPHDSFALGRAASPRCQNVMDGLKTAQKRLIMSYRSMYLSYLLLPSPMQICVWFMDEGTMYTGSPPGLFARRK